jgi:sulfate transport system substrate-binding protein
MGLEADVVTLALALDIDSISENSPYLPTNWAERLPHHSVPFSSTIVFLVRKGNPKNIKDWDDLVKDGVSIITANPKTSGGARWNYLAAWGYAMKKNNGDEAKAEEFVKKLFKNVPVLDAGARASTTTFTQREMGDVLIAWENEAHLAQKLFEKDQYEIVIPSLSIQAETPVAWIDYVVDRKGTRDVSEYYLAFLYTKAAQEIGAKYHFRPVDKEVLEHNRRAFPNIPMLTIEKDFGGWKKAQEKHFKDGGIFDKIYTKK